MIHVNECNHAPNEFIGTVFLNGMEGDLYLYIDKRRASVGEGLRYCFRYGEAGAYETGAAKTLFERESNHDQNN